MSKGSAMYDRDGLIELFKQRALKFGDFTLVSGKKSSYYLDGKQITLHSTDPIIGGVLTVAAERGQSLDGFLVRKEAKGHGTNKYVEGPVAPTAKVVIIDDVVTTGGSSLLAVDRVVEFGCEVVQVVGICDRLQGGAANFAARDLPFKSLLTVEDLGVDVSQNAE